MDILDAIRQVRSDPNTATLSRLNNKEYSIFNEFGYLVFGIKKDEDSVMTKIPFPMVLNFKCEVEKVSWEIAFAALWEGEKIRHEEWEDDTYIIMNNREHIKNHTGELCKIPGRHLEPGNHWIILKG